MRAPLPTVTGVYPLPDDTARLRLEDGSSVLIQATTTPALLPALPGEEEGAPRVFLPDLGQPTAYRVPSRLCSPLAACLRLRRVDG